MIDAISRQAATDIAKELTITVEGYEMHNQAVMNYCAEIMQLPSAQPERKTGRWIKTARWGRVYYCDQCRNYLDFDGVNAGRGSTNFCPNCGAKMERGEQECLTESCGNSDLSAKRNW